MDQDITLVCRACGEPFAFSAAEQTFYAANGFENPPRRCPACRGAQRAQSSAARSQRALFTAVCADCGKETQVPFAPKDGKPVYCRDCFAARRASREG